MTQSTPRFAVVGHPNKGKSSIVSTLTRQDAVRISDISGTTTESQAFNLIIQDELQYQLIDTPGFQRPRQVLSWLAERVTNASERESAVKQFLAENLNTQIEKYKDERELLTPIVEGAGIIYVVDGSLPYSPEFEAEMTILQWSGQPRMALINPIGGEAYVDDWKAALSQYFSVVRVFDPMTADHQKQYTVLSAFAELYEPWREALEGTVSKLKVYFSDLDKKGATIAVEHLIQSLSHQTELKVPAEFAKTLLEESLRKKYQQALRDIESSMHRQLRALYAHPQMQLKQTSLIADTPDLFDSSSWFLYGLDRSKIIGLTTSAGMAAGAVIDIGIGGASLMMGAVAGGVVSGVASAFATWKPEKLSFKGVPLAGKSLLAGPVKDLSFGFVLLGRAVDFLEMMKKRTHADRRAVEFESKLFSQRLKTLSKVEQIQLTRILQKAHKGLNEKEKLQLSDWVSTLSQS
jgi:hypothetical protein